jgi:DOPA 4,5-dioxygenase
LNVLVHPQTGDSLKDHTDHATWLGEPATLKVEMFRK